MIGTKDTDFYQGGVATDDRGTLRFVNGFDFAGVKRFYQVENHQAGFVRAWHGHLREGKYVYVAQGAAIVQAISFQAVEDAQMPERFVLSATQPKVLWIPKGYYNGFKTLTDDTIVMFFSTSTLEESRDDDIRLFVGDIDQSGWVVAQR